MRIGTFTPEIELWPLEEVFKKAKEYGFSQMQYDFLTSHKEEMPEAFFPDELPRIEKACKQYDIEIQCINGTFNMIDIDLERRREGIKRFELIAQACNRLGCEIISLCTGSRDPKSGWVYHPDSASESAWEDMLETTYELIKIAEKYKVYLGVETEPSNVVFTVERTRKLLDQINSPWLKVIMDCANLFPAGTAKKENVRPTIQNAFDVLGKDIILAHGKDIYESDEVKFAAPGKGILDYDFYFSLLKEYNYDRGLIIHGIHREEDFEPCVAFLKERLEAAGL
jgi:sugar phosphate isomerase/epimerase